MKTKLYCHHCQKTYNVQINDVHLMLSYDQENLKRDHGHYYFTGGCFFKTLKTQKETI